MHYIFDKDSNTFQYVVWDEKSAEAMVVDPVRDFDLASVTFGCSHADAIDAFITEKELKLKYIVDTHSHADHVTGMGLLKHRHPDAQSAISKDARGTQEHFKGIYGLTELWKGGECWDKYLSDGDVLLLGDHEVEILSVPGHTNDSVAYYVRDVCCFVGDTLFMPDSGSARCDFPNGNAGKLFDSCQRILSLPDTTTLYMCHDYGAGGSRELAYITSVAEQKATNIHLKDGTTREEYVQMRTTRDATLKLPRLIIPALQVNIQAGLLPEGGAPQRLVLPVDAAKSFSTSA